jgi:hypothetical protein
MDQSDLWDQNVYDALGAIVQAAGGMKRVGHKMWPTLNVGSAEARLRGCLNPDHAQKLDPEELLTLMRIGKEAGEHCMMQLLARELGYEIKPLKPAEAKKQAIRIRRKMLLEQLARLEDDE